MPPFHLPEPERGPRLVLFIFFIAEFRFEATNIALQIAHTWNERGWECYCIPISLDDLAHNVEVKVTMGLQLPLAMQDVEYQPWVSTARSNEDIITVSSSTQLGTVVCVAHAPKEREHMHIQFTSQLFETHPATSPKVVTELGPSARGPEGYTS
ncbi:hypothetical protein FS749_015835 [Ceratobasidium sp. UAMH 11750]|nr:hypothetical protein FS749_015835 [Ceratobasidium sp. UAMH 11750]